MWWFSHMDKRWGHVSLAFLGHKVHLGMKWVRAKKIFIF